MIKTVNPIWLGKFLSDSEYGHLTFKKLDNGYPPFDFPNTIIKNVNEKQFLIEEENVIPLFLGTSIAGLLPRKYSDNLKLFRGQLIAVLSKNILSGCVYGLTIYKIKYNSKYEQKRFSNDE